MRLSIVLFLFQLANASGSDTIASESSEQTKALTALKEFLTKGAESLASIAVKNDTNLTNDFNTLVESVRSVKVLANLRNLQGENICTRNEQRLLPNNDPAQFSGSLKCQQFKHAVRCFEQFVVPEGSNETLQLSQCCDGFETEDIATFGCQKINETKTLKEIALSFGKKKILPLPKAKSTYIVSKNTSGSIIVMPGQQRVYDWFHESKVFDNKGNAYIITFKELLSNRVETYLNCVNLNKTEVLIQEGVVHIAEKPIKPAYGSVMELLEDRFSEFAKLLPQNVQQRLRSSNSKMYTIFAVPNQKLLAYGQAFLKRVQTMNSEMIEFHEFNGFICSYQLPDVTFSTKAGAEFTPKIDKDGSMIIGSSRILETDNVAANGVVHAVDHLLNEWNYRMWYERLRSYNSEFVMELLAQYPGDIPMTIFIPPKDAHKVAKSELQNYVVREAIDSFSFKNTVETDGKCKYFSGRFPNSPRWNVSSNGLEPNDKLKFNQIGCNRLRPTVLKAYNSYIYFLEQPLPECKLNVLGFLKSQPELSNIARLWELFTQETKVEAGFTLFVPMNEAMEKQEVMSMLDDGELRHNFIRNRLINEPICEHSIPTGEEKEFETVHKEKVGIQNRGGKINFRGVQAERLVLSDGVLFLMDHPFKL